MRFFWDVFVDDVFVGTVQAEFGTGRNPVIAARNVRCHLCMTLEREEGKLKVWKVRT